MEDTLLEKVQNFYKFLQGEESNITKKFTLADKSLPKLTEDQAWTIIYILQESLRLIPEHYERCYACGNIYDSYSEGSYINCAECGNNGCDYYEEGITKDCCEYSVGINCRDFCCPECECTTIRRTM